VSQKRNGSGHYVIAVRNAQEYETAMAAIYRICKENKLPLEDNTVSFDVAKHSITIFIACYVTSEGDEALDFSDESKVDFDDHFHLEVFAAAHATYRLRKVLRKHCMEKAGAGHIKEDADNTKWTGISVKGLPDILRECIELGFFVEASWE